MMSAHRYVAYTSDIGESFRPIAHPWLIKSAYGVSWAYLIGDVSYEGYKAYKRNNRIMEPKGQEHLQAVLQASSPQGSPVQSDATTQALSIPAIEDWKSVVAQRAIFQGLASMGLPAFTIHSIVKYSGKALKNAPNPVIRTWGPIGLGLAAVPALPYLFDEPVEHVVEWTFYNAFKAIGGEKAVGQRHSTGRAEALSGDVKTLREAEKKTQ
jgi:fission process protein 1